MNEFSTPTDASVFQSPESQLESEPCSICSQQPAQTQNYMYVMSFLVFTRHANYPAHLCRSCATRTALREHGKSALLGWWGIPWGLMTLQALWINSRALLRWSTLSTGVAFLVGLAGLTLPAAVGYFVYETFRQEAFYKSTGDWVSDEVADLADRAAERTGLGDFEGHAAGEGQREVSQRDRVDDGGSNPFGPAPWQKESKIRGIAHMKASG